MSKCFWFNCHVDVWYFGVIERILIKKLDEPMNTFSLLVKRSMGYKIRTKIHLNGISLE